MSTTPLPELGPDNEDCKKVKDQELKKGDRPMILLSCPNSQFAARIMQRKGYSVIAASNTADAFEVLRHTTSNIGLAICQFDEQLRQDDAAWVLSLRCIKEQIPIVLIESEHEDINIAGRNAFPDDPILPFSHRYETFAAAASNAMAGISKSPS